MTTATSSLSPDQVRRFEQDGYLFPVPVLDEAEIKAGMTAFMAHKTRHDARLAQMAAREKYQVFSQTHFAYPWVYRIASHPRVLDAVESVLGPNVLAWDSNWFVKMPGEKTYVSWHQDGTYWNLNPPSVVSAWISLERAFPGNGCMRVIPGTHTKPRLPQRETYATDNALSRGQEIAVEVDEARAVDLVLAPGEMSLHHIWIVHGSNANTSNVPRIGIAIRYVKPEVVQDSPLKPIAMLVRGRDDHGHFELQRPPTEQSPDAMDATHREIVARIRATVMKNAKA
ncbi:MAG: phytanoyl-CoA dioxygenase family protein [Planctomycetes bacterium]|nr:phytanoyl-CoA dioxygenase family protein [Planctomycetota bacterium]